MPTVSVNARSGRGFRQNVLGNKTGKRNSHNRKTEEAENDWQKRGNLNPNQDSSSSSNNRIVPEFHSLQCGVVVILLVYGSERH